MFEAIESALTLEKRRTSLLPPGVMGHLTMRGFDFSCVYVFPRLRAVFSVRLML